MNYAEILYDIEKQRVPKKEGDVLGSAFNLGLDTAETIIKFHRDIETIKRR